MEARLRAFIKRCLPLGPRRRLMAWMALRGMDRHGLKVVTRDDHFEIQDGQRRIRVGRRHLTYVADILASFDYYFSAVLPVAVDDLLLVDYATPRFHEVVGYDLHPVLFPSFAEPVATTTQYLAFARLEPGCVVLDLGAYSGLTAMIFDTQVGPGGRVVAIDADAFNLSCIRRNLALYERITGRAISLVEGAVWKDGGGLTFSTEGNMGSSAVCYVGAERGALRRVPTFTLSDLVARHGLERVDFIKCDVEGAEMEIFRDEAFFARFRPRIILEPHLTAEGSTVEPCRAQLGRYGYTCREIPQHGVTLPLLECDPG